MYNWKALPNAPIRNALKLQGKDVIGEFERRVAGVSDLALLKKIGTPFGRVFIRALAAAVQEYGRFTRAVVINTNILLRHTKFHCHHSIWTLIKLIFRC